MTDQSLLEEYKELANVQAFLRVIREGESSQEDSAYTTLVGGDHFEDLSKHPRKSVYIARLGVNSTAAGAYQILSRTWDGVVSRYGFTDFSRRSQDLAAIALIAGRNALSDVVQGRFETAIRKCSLEWASLPGSPYGQGGITMERAKRVYQDFGGTFSTSQSAAAPETVSKDKESLDMNFIDIAAAAITAVVPELKTLYDNKGDKDRAAISQAVVNIAKNATAAKNEQEVVEAVRNPEQATAVRQAVRQQWVELQEIGGGMDAAAKRGKDVMDAKKPMWQNPAWAFTLLVMPIIYYVVVMVIGNYGADGINTGSFANEIRVFVVSSIISGVLGSLVGFWVGTSFTSSKKDDALLGKKT